MGYVIYGVTEQGGERNWTTSVLYLFAANAPDMDFLPGLAVGDLSRYYHGHLTALVLQSCLELLRVCLLRDDFTLLLLHPAFPQVRLPGQIHRANVRGGFHAS
jgi:hypothetical protein